MAYNIFAETDKQIDWKELHRKLIPKMRIEFVPMPGMGVNGGDAIGISVPSKNIGNTAWEELGSAIAVLEKEYDFKVYDMYYGAKLDAELLKKVRKSLT